MANPLQSINIAAPGFRGLNTQDSPIGLDPSFCSIANNCVIDQYGRIGARKGREAVTVDATPLGASVGTTKIKEYISPTGVSTVFSTGNNKIFTGTTALTDVTPVGYVPTGDNWKIVNFNYHCYFFQRGHAPLLYSDHDGDLTEIDDHPHSTGTAPEGNEVLAAFGRLWVADITGNTSTIYWSDLLDGAGWTGGSTGSIDITRVWPTGYDDIVALAAHNGFLVIFGKRSIVIYSGPTNPATMVLADTIANVGCIARDSVQNTGTDLIFLSNEGVRSLGRVIQEKSLPFRDISRNVRNDINQLTGLQTLPITSFYSPEEAFYLLSFPTSQAVYCFDMRSPMEDGSQRVTLWNGVRYLCFERLVTSTMYIGNIDGINTYSSYLDNGQTYQMNYFTNPMSFGDSSRLKLLKEMDITVIGGQNTNVTVNWGYDYTGSYRKRTFVVKNAEVSEFNVAEYNVATSVFSASIIIDREKIQTSGNGAVVTVGIDVTVNGVPFSVQEINIQALLGRMI
jgi:hypothetical protein